MSHWTKIKLNLTNQDILQKALTRMGLKVEVGNFTINQYGQSSQATIRVDGAVGLTLEKDGTWSMVGDFYHSGSAKLKSYYGNNAKFQQDLTTAYAVEDIKEKLEGLNMNFDITENAEAQIGADGMIRMVATSWS